MGYFCVRINVRTSRHSTLRIRIVIVIFFVLLFQSLYNMANILHIDPLKKGFRKSFCKKMTFVKDKKYYLGNNHDTPESIANKDFS